ncbi:hypothetical protein C8J57DRAFT_1630657 [Mycena rebaudengoi]|nr:hypothetical protein C8J57DRAFT_1630657 [Mycena rebaudengoi]
MFGFCKLSSLALVTAASAVSVPTELGSRAEVSVGRMGGPTPAAAQVFLVIVCTSGSCSSLNFPTGPTGCLAIPAALNNAINSAQVVPGFNAPSSSDGANCTGTSIIITGNASFADIGFSNWPVPSLLRKARMAPSAKDVSRSTRKRSRSRNSHARNQEDVSEGILTTAINISNACGAGEIILSGESTVLKSLTIYMPECFVARRGLANGLLFAGTAVGGLILPLALPSLISKHGSSKTLRILAISIGTASLLCEGEASSKPSANPRPIPRGGPGLRIWVRQATFWLIIAVNTLQGFAYFVPIVDLPSELPILRSPESI